jgi:DNA-binding transcriptional LysR family regulator
MLERIASVSIAPLRLARLSGTAGNTHLPARPVRPCGDRVSFSNSGKIQDWPLVLPVGEPEVRVRYILTCNNMEALRGAVLRGLGIGCMPDFLAAAALRTGELVPLLVEHLDLPGQFNLIWPSSRHLSPKVRVFVDFISARLFSGECQLHLPK